MSYVLPRQSGTLLRPPAIAGLLLLAAGILFFESLTAMWSVWMTSASFAHGPLIPIAVAWLIWRQRAELERLPMTPWWPAALALAALGFGWLMGRLAGVNTAEQLAVVGMVPAIIALVLGWRVAWAIAFPLAFLFFAVPFGTGLLPTLMEWTADFTVFAVQLSGIPVLREGNSFTLPTGRWSVVESCSGIRYLLAALPIAFLYSYLSYRTYRARVLFIAMTVAIALVGNWLRAYIIVMLGHFSNMTIGVGADHLVYGWLFFAVVISIPLWLGRFIRERELDPPAATSAPVAALADDKPRPGAAAAAAAVGLAVLALWPYGAHSLRAGDHPGFDPGTLSPLLDPVGTPADPKRSYRPQYHGASAQLVGRSRSDPSVQAMIARYARQDRTAEMIHQRNRITPGEPDDPLWQVRSRSTADPRSLGGASPKGLVNEYVIAGPDGLHLVWEWFEVQDEVLNSPARVKLATAFAMLRGAGDESIAWFLWTPLDGSRDGSRSRLAAEAARLGAASSGGAR